MSYYHPVLQLRKLRQRDIQMAQVSVAFIPNSSSSCPSAPPGIQVLLTLVILGISSLPLCSWNNSCICNTDGPRIVMGPLRVFRFYNGAKAIPIH
jgi:hypothetical protein